MIGCDSWLWGVVGGRCDLRWAAVGRRGVMHTYGGSWGFMGVGSGSCLVILPGILANSEFFC